jgi:glycosyltransferase involved in cell wall biosynthesis
VGMKKKKIILIGPVPPPSGGISIHIKRLSILLEKDFDFDFIDEANPAKAEYFNVRSLNIFRYIKKVFGSDVLYIHSGHHVLRMFHVLMGKLCFRKIILTMHAYPFNKGKVAKFIEQVVYGWSDKIILVNANLFDKIKLPKQKCIVQNAFLPPVMETEPEIPEAVDQWIQKTKAAGRQIMCANAWQLEIFAGEDLYGLDMCIEAIDILKKQGYAVAFIFNVASTDKLKDLYLKYQARIKELGLEDNFLLINERLSFVKLIEKTAIVLRPTNTDGDALTVREALILGKPVVASDVVERPEGTILFKTRDVADMAKQLGILVNDISGAGVESKGRAVDYHQLYKNLIESVL